MGKSYYTPEAAERQRLEDMAKELVRAGADDATIESMLMEHGATPDSAAEMHQLALVSIRRQRDSKAESHLRRGKVAVIAGLAITVWAFSGGFPVRAAGIILGYGGWELLFGTTMKLTRGLAPARQVDILRWFTAGLMALSGVGFIAAAENVLDIGLPSGMRWMFVAAGYFTLAAALIAVLDRNSMRLRGEESPYADPQWFTAIQMILIGVALIAVHVVLTQVFIPDSGPALVSPLFTSPLSQ